MPIDESALGAIKYDANGLVPTIVQSAQSGRVLMLAWMSSESLKQTLELGETVFWSRSRQELWHKGATSGNVQTVQSIEVDCDGDTLLIRVTEAGPACHNGTESCFDTTMLLLEESDVYANETGE
ncbi:MAG: phosphoribosyl-AMP cyclohydrolase [Actinomycetales bacterium]|nr:phosphoribosyl-AMP cyclohydrolase [Actinomycetales bacterium]